MAEVERYGELSRDKDAVNERWDEQNRLLLESQERLVREITEEYEAKLLVRLCLGRIDVFVFLLINSLFLPHKLSL